jgi:hypothetical protein
MMLLALSLWFVAVVVAVLPERLYKSRRAAFVADWAGFLGAAAAVYLHPSVTASALGLLSCAPVRVAQTALGALDGGDGAGGTPARSALSAPLVTIDVLQTNAFILCFRGQVRCLSSTVLWPHVYSLVFSQHAQCSIRLPAILQ